MDTNQPPDAAAGRVLGLASRLADRSAEAILGRARIAHDGLRAALRSRLAQSPGAAGSLMAAPLLEAAFGYRAAESTLEEMARSGRLHPDTVSALGQAVPLPGAEGRGRNSLPPTLRPYSHQADAWAALAAEPPRSVLVSAGTGSGKTESFLVPIIDDLARQAVGGKRLTGVQALLLYPLNALIASQKDRLSDWMAPFGGRLRFCLFNGNTPERRRTAADAPWEVQDRTTLRKDPPPVLVTNATMLEYMLLRAQDAPILAASRGGLRYVVLDEAHTYIGSQAAEMALLLRRTLLAFGMEPGQVRFIATSATLGEDSDETKAKLVRFLADMAGVADDRVTVVLGQRHVPSVTADSHGLLGRDPVAVELRERLARGPASFTELAELVAPRPLEPLLEAGMRERGPDGAPFLPLRVHLFHRSQSGLWACVDPACPGRAASGLDRPDWPFGAILERDGPTCAHCKGKTFEVLLCDDCGAPFLEAATDAAHSRLLRPAGGRRIDEFGLDAEREDADDEDEDGEAGLEWLLGPPSLGGAGRIAVQPSSGLLCDTEDGAVVLSRHLTRFCPCCGAGDAGRQLFRRLRVGAPFVVGTAVNLLLDAAPPRGVSNARLPHEGRQLITFTDSRQGTARSAAMGQQQAERAYARSLVYHALQSGKTDDAADRQKLAERIAELERASAVAPGPVLEGMLRDEREKLSALERGGSLRWEELRRHLAEANAEETELLDSWKGMEGRFADPEELARLQLVTEFLRRPVRSNNLETMGLAALRYEAVDRLTEAAVPPLFRENGAGLVDWRDYLYLLLNLVVRGNTAVHVDQTLRRWTGQRFSQRGFARPGEPGQPERRILAWPHLRARGGREHRAVRMLQLGLRLDLDQPAVRTAVNDALEAAWACIGPVGVEAQEAFRLDLTKLSFVPVREAWLCPITRRVLDRAFRGLSPFGSVSLPSGSLRCARLEVPPHPFPWLRDRARVDRTAEVRAWLAADPAIAGLRERGVWTDLHDRTALRAPYVRFVEHSAQQPPARLRHYERLFKDGRVNVMNCSTTMEMGVDIGGITTVAMANVPPSPASYRQRVGRAGRRGEELAVAFTYCNDAPLGWHAFDDPRRFLQARIEPPRVALDSRVLVQRHVNALLLGRFLRTKGVEALKLQSGAFFRGEAGAAPYEAFLNWLAALVPEDADVRGAVRRLVVRSVLQDARDLLTPAADAMSAIAKRWLAERDIVAEDLAAVADPAAKRALEIQLRRTDEEFLFKELARSGFLPGHGFPTDVVSFVALSPADRLPPAPENAGRDDAPHPARGFPTRDLATAIREYAPGADVVLDGVVHRSAGVTLNWRRPATEEDTREIQAIRWFWTCGGCGTTGTTPRRPDMCSRCGTTNLRREEVLEPAGFSTDLAADAGNAVETVTYVPPMRPVFSAGDASWVPAVAPEVGRVRCASDGTVFARSRGPNGFGYALCLACGRAEPESGEGPGSRIPPAMIGHRPLRGLRKRKLSCEADEGGFSVRRHLSLGYERQTDVFELQLFGLSGEASALTLAVALREALCGRLGILRDEVACDAVSAVLPDGSRGWTIVLSDTASGGAGYSCSAAAVLPDLLLDASRSLDCTNPSCDSACPTCLVSRDTADRAEKLDRRKAAADLHAVIAALGSEGPRPFGDDPSQRMARSPLPVEIRLEAAARPGAAVALFLHGDAADWDLPTWWGGRLLEDLGRHDVPLTLAVSPDAATRLGFDDVLELRGLRERCGGRLDVVAWEGSLSAPPGLVAWVGKDDGIGWVETDATAMPPGRIPPAAVFRGRVDGPPWRRVRPLQLDDRLRALRQTTIRQTIARELDGPLRSFGTRFWSLLRGSPAVDAWLSAGPVSSAAYADRYLFSPLVVGLLYSVLASKQGPLAAGATVEVTTMGERDGARYGLPHRLQDDWSAPAVRDSVLDGLLRADGLVARITALDRRSTQHARRLCLTRADGARLTLLLDHGFGHWAPARRVDFDFTASAARQTQILRTLDQTVASRQGASTEIIVDLA
ncbi:MAG: DEAD/DEAH box helicase [Acetobacteraceae bacterium]|nr:DEAD/DEAH box helicase [Acetobacteraceae bacterium]